MKFVTFNIRGAWFADEQNALVHRIGSIFRKIDAEDPDIICFQETDESIRDFFESHFNGYSIIGTGREEDFSGEMTAIMFKKSSVELLGFDTFWLSETPHVAGSKFSCQSEYPRVCTAATFKEKASGKPFFVYNLHLDIFDDAAFLGAKKVLERLAEDKKKYGFPFILAGDFNSSPDSKTMELFFKSENPKLIDHTDEITLTRHGFMNRGEMKKIDYIFTDEKTAKTVSSPDVWDECRDGIWLSDHFPISVTFELI